MTDTGIQEARRALASADRSFPTVITGGRGRRKPPAAELAAPGCPVTPLGHIAGQFFFLDRVGQQVALSARALGNRHELMGLFGGDDAWLRQKFPKTVAKQTLKDGLPQIDVNNKPITQDVTVDFQINQAAKWLVAECFTGGLWGGIDVRKPGVWPDGAGLAAVHCGDEVLIAGEWHQAGHRSDKIIWAAAAATPRPETPCDVSFGTSLQADIQALFRFEKAGAAIVVLGLLGIAYLGGATRWRAAGFLLGPAGCGKTTLLQVLQACCPMHWYSNDTTKAGLEQGLNGRAMPCFLDETEKTGDAHGVRALLDLVLTASGGAGTQGARGGLDGTGRRIEVVGSIIMAATTQPEMRETHAGRFALVRLLRPDAGEDFRNQHAELIAKMKDRGGQLWGRALASFARYGQSLDMFRTALAEEGCAPREMDQLGALLAGWWILTNEGAPNARYAREGVAALAGFVRTSELVAEDSNGRRLLQYLTTKSITLDRSSAREPIGSLIAAMLRASVMMGDGGTSNYVAQKALESHGIRVVRKDEVGSTHKPAPCLSMDGGIWLNHRCIELANLFAGSDWEASRWISGLAEIDSVKRSTGSVRVGTALIKGAIWLPLSELQIGTDDYEDTS